MPTSEARPKYANFPDREPKVVLGAHINATATKALTKLSIGTYEMSFLQQERGKLTCDAVRTALNHLGKANHWQLASEPSREYVGVFSGKGEVIEIKLWITTPFELTQSGHLIRVKVSDAGEVPKVGIAFKLATAFSADEVTNLIRAAQRNVQDLPAGEPYVLKGNPPPRFQKKAESAAAPADGETPVAATGEAPAAEAASDT